MDRKLAKAVERAAAFLEASPRLLWHYKPEWEDGLNSNAVNALAAALGRKPIIEEFNRDNPECPAKPDRFVRFLSVDGDSLEIIVWSQTHSVQFAGSLEYNRRLLQITEAVGILREWASLFRGDESAEVSGKGEGDTAVTTVNARMIDVLSKKPESQGWSAQQWAEHLECSKSSVAESPAWQSLKVVKASAKVEAGARPTDRRRKAKPQGK